MPLFLLLFLLLFLISTNSFATDYKTCDQIFNNGRHPFPGANYMLDRATLKKGVLIYDKTKWTKVTEEGNKLFFDYKSSDYLERWEVVNNRDGTLQSVTKIDTPFLKEGLKGEVKPQLNSRIEFSIDKEGVCIPNQIRYSN